MPTDTSSPGLDWSLLARYLRPHRLQVLVLGLVLAGSIAAQISTPLVTARFIDAATNGGTMTTLVVVALITLALAIMAQGFAIIETWVAERVAWGATNALREDLTAHILHLDAAFHHAHTPGELLERVDGDVGSLARLFSRFTVYVIGNAVLIVVVLGLLFAVDWRVGLGLTLIVLLALAIVLRLRISATPLSAAERQSAAGAYGFLGEFLSGLEDVRSSGARPYVMRRWAILMRGWLSIRKRAGMRGYAMVAIGDGLFGLALALVLAISAVLYRDGALTIGAVFLVYRYADMVSQPLDAIRNEIQDLQQAGASLGRVSRLLDRPSQLVDGDGGMLPAGALAVDVDDVWLGYDPDAAVLRGVSLHIAPGRVLGIIGRTGSGKSTLTRLLPRFHDPDTGSVRLGGVDLRTVPVAAVRSRIGLVTQEAHLFNATLRENLTLFDDAVEDVRLVDVLASVGMAEWYTALPEGLDTMLGAAGIGLSTGQIQVLACARVLLRDPDVVILDEPSSRLDPATERLVHGALARLLPGRTGVVVAHRLQTFDLADDILILENGEVVEHGPRATLAQDAASRYAEMLRLASTEVAR